MSVWAITGKGTFEERGLANLSRSRVNQAIDKLSFDAPGTDFDSDPLLAYREMATITKDGSPFFTGTCVTIPRLGTPVDERISYELSGPWWFLEKCIYQQNWRLLNTDTNPNRLVRTIKSRVILCQDEDGLRMTNGSQIAAAVQYAIERGAQISMGSIDPAVNMPFDECKDISCAEVIIKMLRYSPDYVCWFDYSAVKPVFYCNKSAKSVSVSINAGAPHNTISVTPRYDLQVPGVVIRFEQTHEKDGVTYETCVVQSAGNANDLETLVSTIEMAGSKTITLQQKIVVEELPADLSDIAWWKIKVPYLAAKHSNTAVKINVKSVSATRLGILTNILIEGTIQDWMEVSLGILSEDDQLTAEIDYDILNSEGQVIESVVKHVETLSIIATNAVSKTYKKLSSITSGEDIPKGIATALYSSYSALQCDGRYIYIKEECDGAIFPGTTLIITGGPEVWSGKVQQVDEFIDEGKTTVTFGPAKHLGSEDLVTLLRAFRTRGVASSSGVRITGKSADRSSVIESSGPVPKAEKTMGGGEKTKLVLNVPANGKITLDPTDITHTGADLKVREIAICEDGSEKHMMVLCSESY